MAASWNIGGEMLRVDEMFFAHAYTLRSDKDERVVTESHTTQISV